VRAHEVLAGLVESGEPEAVREELRGHLDNARLRLRAPYTPPATHRPAGTAPRPVVPRLMSRDRPTEPIPPKHRRAPCVPPPSA
ncbi:hypothetical protein Q7689_24970, partial [Nocardiopsis tropica]|nr:hypothetical protein [Nocardiopsis tropica]